MRVPCRFLAAHPVRNEAAKAPYTLDGPKRWWISLADASDPHSSRFKAYTRALLSARDHECAVPHFKQLADYLEIVDPQELARLEDRKRASRKRKSARVQALADGDDWTLWRCRTLTNRRVAQGND
jgi:hypothetical protein